MPSIIAPPPRAPRADKDLLVKTRRSCRNVRNRADLSQHVSPIVDTEAIDRHQLNVRAGADQTVLQISPHTVGDGQSNNERGHTGSHARNRDDGDHADDGLPPLGFR